MNFQMITMEEFAPVLRDKGRPHLTFTPGYQRVSFNQPALDLLAVTVNDKIVFLKDDSGVLVAKSEQPNGFPVIKMGAKMHCARISAKGIFAMGIKIGTNETSASHKLDEEPVEITGGGVAYRLIP